MVNQTSIAGDWTALRVQCRLAYDWIPRASEDLTTFLPITILMNVALHLYTIMSLLREATRSTLLSSLSMCMATMWAGERSQCIWEAVVSIGDP